jgi:hypothetical protein
MSVKVENEGNEADFNAVYRDFFIYIMCYSVLYCADKQDLKV